MIRIIIDTYDENDGDQHQAVQKSFATMDEALADIHRVFGEQLPDFIHHILICACDAEHEFVAIDTPDVLDIPGVGPRGTGLILDDDE